MAFLLFNRGYNTIINMENYNTGLEGNLIGSYPSDVEHRVNNIYVDSTTGDIWMNYIDTAGGEDGTIISEPPSGSYRVINLHVDENGETWVSYDTNPV